MDLRDLLSRHSFKLMVATSTSYKWETNVVNRICIVYTDGEISWVVIIYMHGYGFLFSHRSYITISPLCVPHPSLLSPINVACIYAFYCYICTCVSAVAISQEKTNISACVNCIPYINGAWELGVHERIASVMWMSRIQ